MTNVRMFLWMALFAMAYLLWQTWQTDYRRPPVVVTAATPATASAATGSDVPTAASDTPLLPTTANVAAAALVEATSNGPLISVETDVLRLRIDSHGGALVDVELKKYPLEAGRAEPPVRLLSNVASHWFVAQTGLVAAVGVAPDHVAELQSAQSDYRLQAGVEQLEVPLTWTDASGIKVTKTLIFRRGDYVIRQLQSVQNTGTAPWRGNAYAQLQRSAPPPKAGGFSFSDPQQFSFVGAAWYSPEEKFEKLAFKNFAETPLKRVISGGWAAMLQHYFLAALIPDAGQKMDYSTQVLDYQGQPRYLIRQVGPSFEVAPGATVNTETRLYLGPKLQQTLDTIAPGMGLAMDYGKVRLFAEPVFRYLLNPMHKLAGNWGVAIILTTVLIKLLLFPLASAQYRSMARLREVQPRMEAIKQRYGDDRQKLNQAMMELYQKEKINPAGGCLPIIPQMFVFIALYWVLIESVELRYAPFFGWLTNLSAYDPYFVLPVLNALTMWATQKMSPAPVGMDPMQQKIMQYMPLAFSAIMIFFPSGLVLYWTVNGTLGILQQWWITRRLHQARANS